jgi:MinD-like ATPase involved in chromosome partitioning or flagellar assembly
VLREGYDVGLLNDGFRDLMKDLSLDFLVIDTHPGLNEETLLSIAISGALVIILRPDQQDYQGTAVTVDVARKLEVPNMMLVVNKVPQVFDTEDVKARVENSYKCPVAAVLPHSDEMMALASSGIFAFRYPDNPITEGYKKIVESIKAS